MIKVLKVQMDGVHVECFRMDDKRNPFRIYRKDGTHRRLLAKYGDFVSVLCFMKDFYLSGVDMMSLTDSALWAKKSGSI